MIKLIDKLKSIPKSYYSFADIRKIADMDDQSLKVALSRLVQRGTITRLMKGVYTHDLFFLNMEEFALRVYAPSYISFEWVLAHHGILSQQPHAITLATTRRTKQIETPQNMLVYHHIQPKLFWGYTVHDTLLMAEPEKAFLDLAYISLNGYAMWNWQDMNLSSLNTDILKKYLKKFRNAHLSKIVSRALDNSKKLYKMEVCIPEC